MTQKKMRKKKLNPGLEHLKEFDPNVNFTYKIVDIFNDNYGKVHSDANDIVIMEQKYFYKYISKFIPKEILKYFPNYSEIAEKIKPTKLCLNFLKNRLNYYMEADYDNLLGKGIKYMNKVVIKLGTLQNYFVGIPLIQTMRRYRYGTTLLNVILNIILLAIFCLRLLLIHSLLIITTETHSFEYRVLRLIGNTKKSVVIIIFLECIYFSIPAFILALIIVILFWAK